MRKALIVLSIVVGVFALMITALAIALPRLAQRPEVKQAISDAAQDALGRPVDWTSLGVGLLPPRLLVEDVRVVEPEGSKGLVLGASSIGLKLSLGALISGEVVVQSLAIDGLELALYRDETGLVLPIAPPETEAAAEPPPTSPTAAEAAGAGLALALDQFVISEASLTFVDRTATPPLEIRLEDVSGRASDVSLVGPFPIELTGRLASGGTLSVAGNVSVAPSYELTLTVDAVDLAALAPLVGGVPGLGGRTNGEVRVSGGEAGLGPVVVDLDVADFSGTFGGWPASGTLAVDATIEPEKPTRFEVALDLAKKAGQLNATGSLDAAGGLVVDATLADLDLEPLGRAFAPETGLAGRAKGDVRVRGPAAAPSRIEADLAVADGRIAMDALSVKGPFGLKVGLDDPTADTLRGQLAVDLTTAELASPQGFAKPPGVVASLDARATRRADGRLDFVAPRLRIKNLEAEIKGSMEAGPEGKTKLTITAKPFSLEGWDALVPALADYDLKGEIAAQALEVTLSPMRFGGALELRGLSFAMPDAGRIALRGRVVGQGDRLSFDGLNVLAGKVPIAVDGYVEDPIGARRYGVKLASANDADVNELASALSSVKDRLFGPLVLNANLTGSAGQEAGALADLAGGLKFTIGAGGAGGRLRGASLLRSVLDQLTFPGGAAALSQPFRRGKSVNDYFSEKFDLIEGEFDASQGVVYAKRLRLVYDGYQANLKGPIDLRDFSIDMTGELTLDRDLVSALGKLLGTGGDAKEPITIPLARIGNTLMKPEVKMTGKTLAALPLSIARVTGLSRVTDAAKDKLGGALGEGAERAGKALEGLLGGGKK